MFDKVKFCRKKFPTTFRVRGLSGAYNLKISILEYFSGLFIVNRTIGTTVRVLNKTLLQTQYVTWDVLPTDLIRCRQKNISPLKKKFLPFFSKIPSNVLVWSCEWRFGDLENLKWDAFLGTLIRQKLTAENLKTCFHANIIEKLQFSKYFHFWPSFFGKVFLPAAHELQVSSNKH